MKELVEVIAKSLVDYPEQVIVDEKVDGNHPAFLRFKLPDPR